MGKSGKTRSHLHTGYPYNPIRAAHLQSLRQKQPQEDDKTAVLGLYAKKGHPVFSNTNLAKPHPDMKHLEFLRVYGQYYCTKVAYAYNSSRSLLPASCRTGLQSIEERVTHISAPYLAGLQQGSERVLWTLDSKVDSIVKVAQEVMQPRVLSDARAEHQLVVAEASQARKAYLQQIVESVHYLREHGITGTAKQALGAILSKVDEAQSLPADRESEGLTLVNGVHDAWAKLAALPPVKGVIETAQPSIDFTQRKYGDAHDAVVASATYNRALEAAAEVLQRVQDSPLYKAAAGRLYPAISGIADPAIERITNSSYTKAVVEHLKPIPRPEAEPCAAVPSCMAC
jgi:hypothetical protein